MKRLARGCLFLCMAIIAAGMIAFTIYVFLECYGGPPCSLTPWQPVPTYYQSWKGSY